MLSGWFKIKYSDKLIEIHPQRYRLKFRYYIFSYYFPRAVFPQTYSVVQPSITSELMTLCDTIYSLYHAIDAIDRSPANEFKVFVVIAPLIIQSAGNAPFQNNYCNHHAYQSLFEHGAQSHVRLPCK